MQVIHKNEDERSNSGGADTMGIIICARRISRCLEGKHARRFGSRIVRIWDSKRIFGGHKERVQRRRQEVDKDSRAEKVGVRRDNNREVCTRIQKSSKRKQICRKIIGRRV